MFRFLLCLGLVLVQVFSRPTGDPFFFNTHGFTTEAPRVYTNDAHTWQSRAYASTSGFWYRATSGRPFHFNTNAATDGTRQSYEVTTGARTLQP